jgi:type I restriction enzyme, S subunit
MSVITPVEVRTRNGPPASACKKTHIGALPEDWDVVNIGDLEPFVTSGSRGWAKYYSDFGDPFLRITNMSRGTIYLDLSDLKFVELPARQSEAERTQLRLGDVLISITADIGIIGYVDSRVPLPAYINQHIAVVRFDPARMDNKFVSYFLASEHPQKLFRNLTDQGAKAGMSLLTVRKIALAHPRVEEQRAIAGALSDVDALIGTLDKLIVKKRAIRVATAQQLLTGKNRLPGFATSHVGYTQTDAGVIPEDWRSGPLGSFADLLTGYPFPSREYTNSGIRLVRGSNVKRGVMDWSEEITEHWPAITTDISRYDLKQGDLVIAMDGALVGRSYAVISRTDVPCLLLQRVARIRPKEVDGGLLAHLVCSDAFARHVDSIKTQTAIPHISAEDIRKFLIAIPRDPMEQSAIAKVLCDMDAEIVALEQRRDKTKAAKQGMMQELLTGRTRFV